ncbi:hypothetical protein ACLB1M_28570 [Escherichia coli]
MQKARCWSGDTKVLCTASIEEGVPRFLKGQGQGWITAEYGMLPRLHPVTLVKRRKVSRVDAQWKSSV